jgi:hypothetical protein
VTDESEGELRMFSLGRRITPHVRHREKYVDVPVTEQKAFVFAVPGGAPILARTLRQFVSALETLPRAETAPYLRRGDFSRWIGEVFGDWALAQDLRKHEHRFQSGADLDAVPEVVDAVRGRYDLSDWETGPPEAPALQARVA